MLKGKKKALAAQVLLGLMVASNAYAADITIGEGTDPDSDTNYYAGNHYGGNPVSYTHLTLPTICSV